ncbi:diphthine synthase [Candidatus Woesearchaeota archaeon]|nr:diphthine synthase [Candidatus Woesearchaeota archaeon]
MTLHLISIGLFEKEDMSIRAVETAKKCDKVYLEVYTNYYKNSADEIADFLGKNVKETTRQELENGSKKIVEEAMKMEVGILVVGDALSATTHNVLVLECIEKGVKYDVVHGSSIFTAVAESGLSLYKFGNVTSIPFENENIETPYDVLKTNGGMHTLVLLDLKDGRYMETKDAIKYFLRVESKRKENVFNDDRLCVVFFSIGSEEKEIYAGNAEELLKVESGKKPQCFVVPGKLNFIEEEFLNNFRA